MIEIKDKKNCCGCSSCAQICPKNCITMRRDEEGFLYPNVSQSRCIHCNLCEKVCPVLHGAESGNKNPVVFGGWNREKEVRRNSSSGGVFSLLAKKILDEDGAVYGAAVCNDLQVRHIKAENIEELGPLRESKYIQSDIGEIYIDVRKDLMKDRKVLFTGTPCQVAGLKRFLRHDYQSLYTCDFICHGVPSPLLFEKYIVWLEEKYGSKVDGFEFRNKIAAWKSNGQQMGTVIRFKSGKVLYNIPAFKDPYMNGFLSDICLRPSCLSCQFKNLPKADADITIGDFWGVKQVDPRLYNKSGTSVVIINTDKGLSLFHDIKRNFVGKRIRLEDVMKKNPCLVESPRGQSAKDRNNFFAKLDISFETAQKPYMTAKYWFTYRVMNAVKSGFSIPFNKHSAH